MRVDADAFDLNNPQAYAQWRHKKRQNSPTQWQEFLVDVDNPYELTTSEVNALKRAVSQTNMVVYRSPCLDENPQLAKQVAFQLGMKELDANWLADEDGVSHIAVSKGEQDKTDYIPYTNRGLLWHTDGYYHPQERTISGMVLHCVRSARQGGINELLDPEQVYIALRDENPLWIQALMNPQVMTIPARMDAESGVARAAQSGPVFSVRRDSWGQSYLHMRYTARTRSIEWLDDALTQSALERLRSLLHESNPWVYSVRLEPGMGLIANNVLHTRSDFVDDPEQPRLIYRARFTDRISQSDVLNLSETC